jgi:hypothetical protein
MRALNFSFLANLRRHDRIYTGSQKTYASSRWVQFAENPDFVSLTCFDYLLVYHDAHP